MITESGLTDEMNRLLARLILNSPLVLKLEFGNKAEFIYADMRVEVAGALVRHPRNVGTRRPCPCSRV